MVQLNRKNCNGSLQEFAVEDIQLAVAPELIGSNQSLIDSYEIEKSQPRHTMTLSYGNNHKVDRVWNGKKKDFYPKHLKDDQWENGLGARSKWFPYLHKNLSLAKGKWILSHEGEKATIYATNKGLISTCVVGSGASCETIVSKAISHCSFLDIQGIIYLADNDEQGMKKARFFQQQAKKLGFPCLVLPLKAIYPEAEKGDDFVEYFKANPNHSTKDIVNDIEIAIDDYQDSLVKDYENCDQEPERLVKSNNSRVINFPHQIDTQGALQAVENAIGLTGRALLGQLLKISKDYGINVNELQQYHESLLRDSESEEAVTDNKEWLNDILAIEQSQLNLYDILDSDLAQQITELANEMRSTPEHLFTALLPTWATGIGTKSRIVISPKIGYVQPAIIRTMNLANSGDRKSPILKNAIAGVSNIESENRKQYQEELQEYQQELSYWKLDKSKDKGEPPPEPTEKRIIVKNVNIDGLIRIHSENPDGLLVVNDELNGYFARQNKQTGKGDDTEQDLELFNGDSLTKDRMGKEFSYYVPRTSVSIVGSIQWKVLRKLIQRVGEEDGAGTIARWLICAKEMPPAYLDILNNDSQLFDNFKYTQQTIFEQLRELPETDYLLSDQAKVLWQDFQHELEDMRQAETIEALRIYYPKAETYVCRIALVLHCLEQLMNNSHSTTISADTVRRAIKVVLFYLGQYKMVVAKVNPATDSLSGELLRIRDLLKRHKELTPRIVKRCDRQLAKTKNVDSLIKEYFQTLVDAGIAEWIPSKTSKIGLISSSVNTSVNNCQKVSTQAKANNNNSFIHQKKTKCQQVSTLLTLPEDNNNNGFKSKCQQNDQVNFSFSTFDERAEEAQEINNSVDNLSTLPSKTVIKQGLDNCQHPLTVVTLRETDKDRPIENKTFEQSVNIDTSVDTSVDKEIISLAEKLNYDNSVLNNLSHDYFSVYDWRALLEPQKQELKTQLKFKVSINRR